MIGTAETLGTIWEIPVHLGEQIRPVILEMDPLQATGRKRVDPRRMVDGIAFRMRSGCQWNRLSQELGDDSTIHRTFQALSSAGWSWECLSSSGRYGLRSKRNWAGWSGNGRLRTAPWARTVLGGFSRPQSHGPGQGR